MQSTIGSIITPKMKSAVGVIRISGPRALEIVNNHLEVKNSNKNISFLAEESHKIRLYNFVRVDKSVIDEVLVFKMISPNSYTGEDVVEIQCHGNPLILNLIMKELISSGIEQSQRGEFTKRAFLNGKLSLEQCEMVQNIIDSKNKRALNASLNTYFGHITKEINEIQNNLMNLIAYFEASLDFPEDEISGAINEHNYIEVIKDIKESIWKKVSTYDSGKLVDQGIDTLLIGEPNSGKSTILNKLLKEDRAIVSDIPGTTRDVIKESLNMGDLTLNLMDTAGIRNSVETIESIGITKSLDLVENVSLVLLVHDSSKDLSSWEVNFIGELQKQERIFIVINNKVDLKLHDSLLKTFEDIHVEPIDLSAISNEGFSQLEERILHLFNINDFDSDSSNINERHFSSLSRAFERINNVYLKCLSGDEDFIQLEFLSIDLKNVYDDLGEISGTSLDTNLIDTIFSNFCIGK